MLQKKHPKQIRNRIRLLFMSAAFLLFMTAVYVIKAEELKEKETGICSVDGNAYVCHLEDGSLHKKAAIHYFDRIRVGNATFSGWYYHDADGTYHAGNVRLLTLPDQTGTIHAVGNLGKLTASPQIRYVKTAPEGTALTPGFYYFDGTGRLLLEPGLHYADQVENGRSFHGCYYFGENGRLMEEAGETPEGLPFGADGKVSDSETPGFDLMEQQLNALLKEDENTWSIYVKNLQTGEEYIYEDQPLYAASLIKLFVMARTLQNLEEVAGHLEVSGEDPAGDARQVRDLVDRMITVSDNEAFNELVRLQTTSLSFLDGAEKIDEFLLEEGYSDTTVQSTLMPSTSREESLGGRNMTSVVDCAAPLEAIYRGRCKDPEVSGEMLDLLLKQEETWKIPEGLPKDIVCANKTGETDHNQHDAAIVYGKDVTYLLCVMSEYEGDEGDAIDRVQDISRIVYHALNLS